MCCWCRDYPSQPSGKMNRAIKSDRQREWALFTTAGPTILFERHQPFPSTTKPQLNPKSCREQDVDFTCFNFLEIPSGDLGSFGQFILRQAFAHPLSSHVRTEHLNSCPLFFGYSHDILHRLESKLLNDTYIVKKSCKPLCKRCKNAARLEKRAASYRRHMPELEMPSRKRCPEVSHCRRNRNEVLRY